jgi:hypothetical protein
VVSSAPVVPQSVLSLAGLLVELSVELLAELLVAPWAELLVEL